MLDAMSSPQHSDTARGVRAADRRFYDDLWSAGYLVAPHRFERTAVFGMEPRSRWLLDFAVWGLTKRRVQALRWYNTLFLPLGLLLQRRLEWGSGLIDVAGVGELLLACRRS